MPGPLMHQSAMEQCRSLLQQIGIPVNVGSKVDVMGPDTEGAHGYNFLNNSGGIINNMDEQFELIRQDFRNCGKNLTQLNLSVFSHHVQYLGHYCTDAHTIGQISSEFWGKGGDDKFDVACEFIPNKKASAVSLKVYPNKDHLRSAVLASMRSVYDTYRGNAKKWNFIFSGSIINMARNAVKCGAEFSASWVKLAWDSV